MGFQENTTFQLAKPAFLRYNGKFTLEAFIYEKFLNRHFWKLRNLNLKTGTELQTKLQKTVDERQIGKEKRKTKRAFSWKLPSNAK